LLPFFTDPYPDELIYSDISRFHFYSGNINFVETLEELFHSRTVVPSIEFGSHFSALVQNLGSNYSVERLLAQNTIYPYFSPFITIERQKKVFEDTRTNGQGIHGRLGISGGKISSKQGLYYCSKWLTNYLRNSIHPFRHLLLLYFFDQDIDSFLEIKEDDGPFGRGPWPCLNKAAQHYKELVISEVEIKTRDKVLIGKFSCSCGFEYTRIGPDKSEEDKWRKSRITAYGNVWEGKFKELVNMNISRKEIASELDVSLRTIYKLIDLQITTPELTEKYRAELLEWKEKFPNANRKQFQTELKKLLLIYIITIENGLMTISLQNVIHRIHRAIQMLL
jgi:hypothetical protein